jgi:hypothetical protein
VKEETVTTLIGAAIGLGGALIGALFAWLAARSTNRAQEKIAQENARAQQRAFIDSLVIKMIEISMEYPYLEREEFCNTYPNCSGHPHSKERYENFCIFVFNLLMMIYRHFEGDRKRIGEYIHVEELVRLHCTWWLADRENLEYDEPFRQYIHAVVDKLKREGKIK